MIANKVELLTDEKILFETDRAVLTNQRLLASVNRKSQGAITHEVLLRDIATFKKSNGGIESRTRPGLMLLGAGLVITLVQYIATPFIPDLVEGILFLAGALGILVGIYLVMSSVMRVKPHTFVLFTVVGSQDIPVQFPGRDSPDADEMTRLFVRAKRGI